MPAKKQPAIASKPTGNYHSNHTTTRIISGILILLLGILLLADVFTLAQTFAIVLLLCGINYLFFHKMCCH